MAFGMNTPAMSPMGQEKTPTMKMAAPMKKKKKAMPKETPASEAKEHGLPFLRKAMAAKRG